MGCTVGLDMGSSTTKIVFWEDGQVTDRLRIERNQSFEPVLKEKGLEKIDKIVTVGSGSSYLEGDILGIPTEHIEEFEAIALGGKAAVGLDKCLIVSLGTGTCFIYSDKDKTTHAGGCGIGGALLASLADFGLGMKNVNDFMELALSGDASKADLRINDISKDNIDTLYGEVTVANMAKITRNSSPEDYAFGVCNLVFQNVGVMAVMAARSFDTDKIVVLGSVADSRVALECFSGVGSLFGVDFIVPEDSAFAVANGAALGRV